MIWKPFLTVALVAVVFATKAAPVIHVNEVAYDAAGPKVAVVEATRKLAGGSEFWVKDLATGSNVFQGKLTGGGEVGDWFPGRYFYQADFSELKKEGRFEVDVAEAKSFGFEIGENVLERETVPAILGFYQHQRANSPEELAVDRRLILFGSTNTVDLRGGWCDASGDCSKYFSHLAYANFMSPQQTPLVVWSMVNAVNTDAAFLDKLGMRDGFQEEALYGADYLMRSLSPEGYFYMTVFSYFKKDPEARRVVGLLANSVTTSDYQCAYREGGGMAIAALARISRWHVGRDFTSQQYLAGAERAFAHLQKNNLKYDDDGKENIIDDYCALMAATELWIATDKTEYRDEARKRAKNLAGRMSPAGYFIANDANRPFWHAADAGLPVVALARYLNKEEDAANRESALATIKRALDYNLRVTSEVNNPFGYARQSFLFRGAVKDGFFIPHENETGWWWQGEDARLASLATAAIVGGRLVYPGAGAFGVREDLARFASDQIAWILGKNPFDVCLMFGFGTNNVPMMHSMFGHGTGKGGVSNGITGKEGNPDGSGIDFKLEDNGNEWRWTEQWIPHAAWFLQAMTAMSMPVEEQTVESESGTNRFRVLVLAERGDQHEPFVAAALKWLKGEASQEHFAVDVYANPDKVNAEFLKKYALVLQLNYPPYHWSDEAKAAFQDYIEQGKGGWVGLHHATLLGEFDGYAMWQWFSDFMGGIRFRNYIAKRAAGNVIVEDTNHPCFRGLPERFAVKEEEWYIYDKDPRPNVHVLARVDEDSYDPQSDIKMGDHPVVWTNPRMKARNVYILMGHHPTLLDNEDYKKLLLNSILWAAGVNN
jgi:type 1 glutamine amidotransferase